MHEQDEKAKAIWTHRHHYVKQLHPINVEAPRYRDAEEAVTEALQGAYSSLFGGVAWLAQTMLPVCVYSSYLQRCG
eukprot:11011487-Karenia_brevis.AAC.1